MIHEITPHVYDNAFRICTPKDSDVALYYAGKDMLI